MPLEEVIDKALEYYLEDLEEVPTMIIRVILAIVFTLILGYFGLRLVDIQTSRKGQDYLILQFLKGNPVKLHDLIKKYK